MDLGLKDRVVVSLGGTSNLGRGASIELCKEGAKVFAIYVSNDAKAREAEELIRGQGGEYTAFKADMTDENEVDRAFKACLEKYGRIDAVICGAIYDKSSPIHEMSLELWRKGMDINLTTVFLMNRWAIRYWLENKMEGRILNYTSVSAFQGDFTPRCYYAASKNAVIGMTKSIAREVGKKGILVNCISPGFSGDWELPQEYVDRYLPRIPQGKIGKSADLAPVVAFMVSPANTYMLGATVDVSGGMTMH